jgi:hypothetical protein
MDLSATSMFSIIRRLDKTRYGQPLVVNDFGIAYFLDLRPCESFNKTRPSQRDVC